MESNGVGYRCSQGSGERTRVSCEHEKNTSGPTSCYTVLDIREVQPVWNPHAHNLNLLRREAGLKLHAVVRVVLQAGRYSIVSVLYDG